MVIHLLLFFVCSMHGNSESDIHQDHKNTSTKMSAVEWLVFAVVFCMNWILCIVHW